MPTAPRTAVGIFRVWFWFVLWPPPHELPFWEALPCRYGRWSLWSASCSPAGRQAIGPSCFLTLHMRVRACDPGPTYSPNTGRLGAEGKRPRPREPGARQRPPPCSADIASGDRSHGPQQRVPLRLWFLRPFVLLVLVAWGPSLPGNAIFS